MAILEGEHILRSRPPNGLETAYADKHLSYSLVSGPSGLGLSQGLFPELQRVAANDFAQNAWDDLHWSALANWTQGNFANGTSNPAGTPAVLGASFLH